MVRRCQLIGGAVVGSSSGAVFENVNPTTEEVFDQVAEATRDDVLAAIGSARTAFDTTDWSRALQFRLECLRQLQTSLKAQKEDLGAILVAELGCPINGSLGRQLDGAFDELSVLVDAAESVCYPRQPPPADDSNRLLLQVPHGVLSAFLPFNYPILNLLIKVGSALAAGNTVVVKPSPLTSSTVAAVGSLIAEATDIPAGVVNVVTSSRDDVAEILVEDDRVDMVTFTGSTATGRRIAQVATRSVKRTLLGLSGKSACILLEDAPLEDAVVATLRETFELAGQGCAKLTRLLVPEHLHDQALEFAVQVARCLVVGDPRDELTQIGPMISRRNRQRAVEIIGKGCRDAVLAVGGQPPPSRSRGFFLEPTVFGATPPRSAVATEEIFGPVVCLIPYTSEETAIEIANDSVYGLSGGVWGTDLNRCLSVAGRMDCGTVRINGHAVGNDMPFGGMKQSGIGREMGPFGLQEYLTFKVVGYPAIAEMKDTH